MKIKVVGKRTYDFMPEKGTKNVVGARIYGVITQNDCPDADVQGCEVFSESISDMSAYDAVIGKEYYVTLTLSKVRDKQSGQVYNVAKPSKLTPA